MKLLHATVENFGSYNHLDFSFVNQGLALVYGATGSGKSTLQDIPSWVLFGVTAKEGSVDDIRRWGSTEPTTGKLTIELSNEVITITRIRGKPSQNDLFWTDASGIDHRGKDITETQKLLNDKLRITSELFNAASYYNEFSSTAQFFTAKSKERRELFEKLANLDFAVQIAEKASVVKKELKKSATSLSGDYNRLLGRLDQLNHSKSTLDGDIQGWERAHQENLDEIKFKSKNYEQEKAEKLQILSNKSTIFEKERNENIASLLDKLEALDEKLNKVNHIKCPTCGQVDKTANDNLRKFDELKAKLFQWQEKENPYPNQISELEKQQNYYDGLFKVEEAKTNPFVAQLGRLSKSIEEVQDQVATMKIRVAELEHKIVSLTQLYDLSFELRSELVKSAVKRIQFLTNTYLETHFDSEIRVEFNADSSDNLEINIWKNGHECTYQQLSKGQRGLLKLCFSTSVMGLAADKAGIHFNTILFDESLDGLDTSLKLKAFTLFSELSLKHENVLVIDHSVELQHLFNKQYYVKLENDISKIEVTNE